MDILGVGPLELLFIFLIALIILGPTDMVKTGHTMGRLLRKVVTSETWREITRLRTLPNQLMREAGLEEQIKELQEIQKELPKGLDFKQDTGLGELQRENNKPDLSAWTGSIPTSSPSNSPPELDRPSVSEEDEIQTGETGNPNT